MAAMTAFRVVARYMQTNRKRLFGSELRAPERCIQDRCDREAVSAIAISPGHVHRSRHRKTKVPPLIFCATGVALRHNSFPLLSAGPHERFRVRFLFPFHPRSSQQPGINLLRPGRADQDQLDRRIIEPALKHPIIALLAESCRIGARLPNAQHSRMFGAGSLAAQFH